MSNQRFSPEFKDEAVRQIVDRGYSGQSFRTIVDSIYTFVSTFLEYVDRCGPEFAAMLGVESTFIGGVATFLMFIAGVELIPALAVAAILSWIVAKIDDAIVDSAPICNRP